MTCYEECTPLWYRLQSSVCNRELFLCISKSSGMNIIKICLLRCFLTQFRTVITNECELGLCSHVIFKILHILKKTNRFFLENLLECELAS